MTEAQKELLEKSGRCLQAAELLLANGFPADAVSRAYYCMFHAAQALMEKDGHHFSKHGAVISAFGKFYAHTGIVPVEFHRYLIDAFDARTQGDYAPGEQLTEAKAALFLDHARTFNLFINNLVRSS